MPIHRASVLVALVAAAALAALACNSKPENPYPQGYPQAYPQQQMQQAPGYPQQQAAPGQMQQAQPAQQAARPAQPAQPGQQPAGQQQQNPLAGLAALGQAMQGMQQGAQGAQGAQGGSATVGGVVAWGELTKALPTAAPGWQLQGQPEGETAAAMGISVSTARCTLSQGSMKAKVEIIDNAMAAGMAAMGFAMVPTVDSSTERVGKVTIGGNSGMKTFTKSKSEAEIVLVMNSRLMINVTVENTPSEQPAVALAQQINYPLLRSLIGG